MGGLWAAGGCCGTWYGLNLWNCRGRISGEGEPDEVDDGVEAVGGGGGVRLAAAAATAAAWAWA